MGSLKDTIRKYSGELGKAGIDSPEKDVRRLVCSALELNAIDLINNLDRLLLKHELLKLDSLVDRRKKFEPISKITNKKLFWDLEFFVNQEVLDPRPESELLVEKIIEQTGKRRTVLELGTGSGCVAIVLANVMKHIEVAGCDVSREALKVAKKNASKHDVHVNFFLSDWFSNVDRKYDIIVSNPPYISEKEFLDLANDVKYFEPRLALLGGEDGLDCFRLIAKSISLYMNDGGLAFFEIGYGQANNILNIFSDAGFSIKNIWKDLTQKDRVLCVKKDA